MEDEIKQLTFHSNEELIEYLRTHEPGGLIDIRIEKEGTDGDKGSSDTGDA